jgi:hypothetical protein
MNDKVTYDIKDILAKEQFKVKLGFTYFLMSGWSITILAIMLVSGMDLLAIVSIYLFLLVMAYKFLFGFTKNGEFYEAYMYKKLAKFIRLIRSRMPKR